MTTEPEQKRHLVCAIYTRKSSSEGLDQEFSSLDNQRESAASYIKSQQHEGWTASSELYDDGGFTGANVERPGLQKLLSHIKEGKINCVVVYKVDRLSRSLLDFSQLLEFFDKNNVVFVSITQHFNTNTSMGRLTLNILLSFAQFEREIISERTKDKLSAARKRGQWLGGHPPFGYMRDPKENRKIIINPAEVDMVRKVYALYLEKNSALEVAQEITATGYRTPSWPTKTGRTFGNKKFSITTIVRMLKNHTYIGKANYQGKTYDGLQSAIIDEETFNKVQDRMSHHRLDRKPFKNKDCSGLLSKVLKCKACGSAMVHTYTLKKNRFKYRYYLCSNAQKRGYAECPVRYVNAQLMEERIEQILRGEVKTLKNSPHKSESEAILSPIWDSLFFEEKRRIIRTLIKVADYDSTAKKIGMVLNGTTERMEFDSNIKRIHANTIKGKQRQLDHEPAIRKQLLLAHHLNRNLSDGKIKDLNQASAWLGFSQTSLSHILGLLNLSPSIQTEIITGNAPILDSIPEYKLRDISSEMDWTKQAVLWQAIKTSLSYKSSISALLKPESPIPSKWILQS